MPARPQLNLFLDADVYADVVNAAASEMQKRAAFGKILFLYAWQECKRVGSLKELCAGRNVPKTAKGWRRDTAS